MTTAKFDRNAARIVLEAKIGWLELDQEMIEPKSPEGEIMTIVLNERLKDLDPILEIIDQDWSDKELMETINKRIGFVEETYPDDKWTQRRIADLNRIKVVLMGQDA